MNGLLKRVEEAEKEIIRIKALKIKAIVNQNFEDASNYRLAEKKLIDEIEVINILLSNIKQ